MKKTGFFKSARFISSVAATGLMNLKGFGLSLRSVCSPGFHCHGCPLATAACPVGVFAFSSALKQIPVFAISWILLIGLAFGRLACSFACPFGLLQELLHRIPSPKIRLPEWTRAIKYFALALLVFILPWALGFEESGCLKLSSKVDKGEDGMVALAVSAENLGSQKVVSPSLSCAYVAKDGGRVLLRKDFRLDGVSIEAGKDAKILETSLPNMLSEANLVVSSPQSVPASKPRHGLYFCRICPDGALFASLPAKLAASGGDGLFSAGSLLDVKYLILLAFLVLMVLSSRPFCRILCPLGAIYALASKLAFFRVVRTVEPCVSCGLCDKVCPVGLDVRKRVGGPECIACGECVKVCPKGCFAKGFVFSPANRGADKAAADVK